MTYKNILYFGTCVVGLNTNNIFSCCSSEEQKLSKEYIAKALGVTVDKIWAFEVFNFEDLYKYESKNTKYGNLKTHKMLVDNCDDEKYLNSCFVTLLCVKDKKSTKCCCALVSNGNDIKVNDKLLEPVSNFINDRENFVFMSLYRNVNAYYTEVVNNATIASVGLENDTIQLRTIMKNVERAMLSKGTLNFYFCK